MTSYGSGIVNERELKLQQERKERARGLSKKLNTLFVVSILGLILLGLIIVTAIYGTVAIREYDVDKAEKAVTMLRLFAIGAIVLAVVQGVTLLSMKEYHDDFGSAGGLFIFSEIMSLLRYLIGTSSGLSSFFSLIGSVLSILFILQFCSAMIASFQAINNGMASDWESFKTVYFVGTIGSIISIVVAIMPGLAVLGVLGVYGFAIMLLIVSIWRIVLIRRSSQEMLYYSVRPIEEERSSGAGAFRNLDLSGQKKKAGPPAPTKPTMSREEAMERAEEMRKRRQMKAEGLLSEENAETSSKDVKDEQKVIDVLKEYKELLDSGVITEEEFQKKKKELLDSDDK